MERSRRVVFYFANRVKDPFWKKMTSCSAIKCKAPVFGRGSVTGILPESYFTTTNFFVCTKLPACKR